MTERPPAHLSKAAKQMWNDITAGYVFDPHHVRLLTTACEAWDRMNQARELLASEGVTYVDRFGAPRCHPAVAIERDSRIAFVRTVRELNLDADPQTGRVSHVA
jgi:P27 family predicted phage terminase small subunit